MRQLHRFLILMAFIAASGSGSAWAAACKVTPGVQGSAGTIALNNAAGGHVTLHIRGNATEPQKSQFNNAAQFILAWNAWMAYNGAVTVAMPDPKICGGAAGGKMDCVSAASLGITEAYVCDAVDQNGFCNAGRGFVPEKVAFRYAKNGAGIWILNTAYPSANLDCQ